MILYHGSKVAVRTLELRINQRGFRERLLNDQRPGTGDPVGQAHRRPSEKAKTPCVSLDYCNKNVIRRIIDTYGLSPMDAARGVTQEIYDTCELYHTERLENAFLDIDNLLETGKHAW